MLRQSKDSIVNEGKGAQERPFAVMPEKKRDNGPWETVLSLIMAVIVTGAGILITTLTTFFGKVAATLRFLPFVSLVCDTVNWLYYFRKHWLKSQPLSKKIANAVISLIAYAANVLPTLLGGLIVSFNLTSLSVIAPYLPIVLCFSSLVSMAISAKDLAETAHGYITKPWTRTPETALRFTSRGVKTTALATLTALALPFCLATGGILVTAGLFNPFTAGPVAATLFSLIIAASITLIVMKLIKKYTERRLQEKEAKAAARWTRTPYEILGVNTQQLNSVDNHQRKKCLAEAYQKNEDVILKNSLNKEKKFEQLRENHLAFELLKSPRATMLYQKYKQEDNHGGENSSTKIMVSLARNHPVNPVGQGAKIFASPKATEEIMPIDNHILALYIPPSRSPLTWLLSNPPEPRPRGFW